MSDLRFWQEKIAEKRKTTSFKDFVKDIMSWDTLVLQKNNNLISRYPSTERIGKVVSTKEFETDRDQLVNSGLDYDFSMNFFENYKRLYKNAKFPSLVNIWSENCDYSDISVFVRNAYLSFTTVTDCENVLYSVNIKDGSRNIYNSVMVWDKCENVYMSSGILRSMNVYYSQNILNSSDVWFSTNLVWCHECISCNWLENASYYINNISYSQKEFLAKKHELLKNKSWFEWLRTKEKIVSGNVGSTNITGALNFECHNITNGVYNYRVTDGKNIIFVGLPNWNNNIYDTYNAGSPVGNNMFGVMGAGWEHIYLSLHNNNGMCNFYSILLDESSFCLGCFWLKNKQYCILNKQYSKEDWLVLADKIFTQMENDKILGDFFPATMNPYYFNDTVASMFNIGLSKEEIKKEWFMWREEELRVDIPDGLETIQHSDLSQYESFDDTGKWQIDEQILKKVIIDANGNSYRIMPIERDFLQKHSLPLPRIHWLERMKTWFNFRT